MAPGVGEPCVDGKFLVLKGRRFWIKGVTYGSFRPNDEGEPYPAFSRVKDDFARMRDAGINTVRLFSPPPDRIADAAAALAALRRHGLGLRRGHSFGGLLLRRHAAPLPADALPVARPTVARRGCVLSR
jgi:hypothetical protein